MNSQQDEPAERRRKLEAIEDGIVRQQSGTRRDLILLAILAVALLIGFVVYILPGHSEPHLAIP